MTDIVETSELQLRLQRLSDLLLQKKMKSTTIDNTTTNNNTDEEARNDTAAPTDQNSSASSAVILEEIFSICHLASNTAEDALLALRTILPILSSTPATTSAVTTTADAAPGAGIITTTTTTTTNNASNNVAPNDDVFAVLIQHLLHTWPPHITTSILMQTIDDPVFTAFLTSMISSIPTRQLFSNNGLLTEFIVRVCTCIRDAVCGHTSNDDLNAEDQARHKRIQVPLHLLQLLHSTVVALLPAHVAHMKTDDVSLTPLSPTTSNSTLLHITPSSESSMADIETSRVKTKSMDGMHYCYGAILAISSLCDPIPVSASSSNENHMNESSTNATKNAESDVNTNEASFMCKKIESHVLSGGTGTRSSVYSKYFVKAMYFLKCNEWLQRICIVHGIHAYVHRIEHPEMSGILGPVAAVAMQVCDYWETNTKCLGLSTLHHILRNVNPSELRSNNLNKVLYDVLEHAIQIRECSVLDQAFESFPILLPSIEYRPDIRDSPAHDKIFLRMLRDMQYEGKNTIKMVYITHLTPMIAVLRSSVIKHLKLTLAVLFRYLSAYDDLVKIKATTALLTLIEHAWPRISYHRKTIEEALQRCEAEVSDQVQKALVIHAIAPVRARMGDLNDIVARV